MVLGGGDEHDAGLAQLVVDHRVMAAVTGEPVDFVDDAVGDQVGQDRTYVRALRDAGVPGDPRVGSSATMDDWLPGVHERQLRTSPDDEIATGRPVQRHLLECARDGSLVEVGVERVEEFVQELVEAALVGGGQA